MSASINAIASYFKLPIVWLVGLYTAIGIMAVYATMTYINIWIGLVTFLAFLNILPFFLAGIYGMILDGNTKKGSFLVYAKYGYSRCLSPALFIVLICLLIDLLLGPFGLILLIPVLFFIYFADITAIRHNLRTGQAIKDSARRALSGSILVIIFYLGNIVACILCALVINFVFEGVVQLFVSPENLTSLNNIVESAVTTLSQNLFSIDTTSQNLFSMDALGQNLFAGDAAKESMLTGILQQFMATPGLMLAIASSLAIGSLIFMPFFVAYKAYFFRDLLIAEATVAAVVKAAQEKARQANAGEQADLSQNPAYNSPEPSDEKTELPDLIPEKPKEPKNPAYLAYDPHAGEDGEYDAKGRWFKYK